jgi:hypothetical protein
MNTILRLPGGEARRQNTGTMWLLHTARGTRVSSAARGRLAAAAVLSLLVLSDSLTTVSALGPSTFIPHIFLTPTSVPSTYAPMLLNATITGVLCGASSGGGDTCWDDYNVYSVPATNATAWCKVCSMSWCGAALLQGFYCASSSVEAAALCNLASS